MKSINYMNDSRVFKDAESVLSGLSPTFPVNWRYFNLIVILEGCKAVLGECGAAMISRQIFGFSGNFCKSTGVFFITLSRMIQSLDF